MKYIETFLCMVFVEWGIYANAENKGLVLCGQTVASIISDAVWTK